MDIIWFCEERNKRARGCTTAGHGGRSSARLVKSPHQATGTRKIPLSTQEAGCDAQVIPFPAPSAHQSPQAGAASEDAAYPHAVNIAKKALDLISAELDDQAACALDKPEHMIHILESLSLLAEDLREATISS